MQLKGNVVVTFEQPDPAAAATVSLQMVGDDGALLFEAGPWTVGDHMALTFGEACVECTIDATGTYSPALSSPVATALHAREGARALAKAALGPPYKPMPQPSGPGMAPPKPPVVPPKK